MLRRRSLLAAGLAAAGTALAPRASGAAEAGVIRIGYQKNSLLAVARERGTLEGGLRAQGTAVRWVEFSFGPPLLEALSLGAIDFGTTGDAPPIFAQAAGADLVYAAAQPKGGAGAAILLPKGSTVEGLAGLKGKRVAFAKGSSAHNLTVAALEKAGLSYGDITPVLLTPADGAAAFSGGTIDAWTAWDPYYAVAEEREGTRVLARSADIAPINSFFLANRRFAGEQPAALTGTIRVLGEVAAWCETHRDSVAESLSRLTGIPLSVQRRAAERVRYAVAPMDAAILAEQQHVADRFLRVGVIPRPVRVADIVWRRPTSDNG